MKMSLTLIMFLCISLGFSQKNDHLTTRHSTNKKPAVFFEENKGQIRDQEWQPRADVLFSGNSGGLIYHLKTNGLHYSLRKTETWQKVENALSDRYAEDSIPARIGTYRVDVNWIGANKDVEIIKGEALSGYKNYYNVPEGVEAALFVKSYSDIIYKNIYNGIDLHFYEGFHGGLEYDFIVKPGADYKQIQMHIKGAELEVNPQGELVMHTPYGEIIEGVLKVYQNNEQINSSWKLRDNLVSFSLVDYDPESALRIDPPVRVWGTYYGGGGDERISDVSMGKDGNLYIAGWTNSTNAIATTGAHQVTLSGSTNAFLTKMDTSGLPLWSTYYGGLDTRGTSCAIGANRKIFLGGYTRSTTNIATPGSHQTNLNNAASNNPDAFLVQFDTNGIREWGTYYGGAAWEKGLCVEADNSGNAYLGGWTESTNNISSTGAHQTGLAGFNDGFMVKFDTTGIRKWGSYYGGSGSYDEINSFALDKNGSLIFAGQTNSPSGIATSGVHQQNLVGFVSDAFVAKMTPNGIRVWGTYYGGPHPDWSNSCAVDVNGNVYLTGYTSSTSGIAGPGAHENSPSGTFLVKFTTGGALGWGSYFGSNANDMGHSCTIDNKGNVYITGETRSASGIATSAAHQTSYNGSADAFVTQFSIEGIQKWGTYYGGSAGDVGYSCVLDGHGNLYLAGETKSTNAIASPGAHQTTHSGGATSFSDGFLTKLNYCSNTNSSLTDTVCDLLTSPSGRYTWTNTGIYLDTIPNYGGCDSIITVDLTVKASSGDTISPIACDTYVSPSGKYTWNGTGLYFDTIPNAVGCDSIISINLALHHSATDSVTLSACKSFTSASGNYTWTTSGTYLDTISTIKGCDSVITYNLTLHTIDTTIFKASDTLKANAGGTTSYQWVDCSNGFTAIPGETKRNFLAQRNGSYAVIISDSICSDTSACINITDIGLVHYIISKNIKVYPNPTEGDFTLELSRPYAEVRISITDLAGKVVYSQSDLQGQEFELQLPHSKGTYLVEVIADDESMITKVIKE